jgi:hypothetical protein
MVYSAASGKINMAVINGTGSMSTLAGDTAILNAWNTFACVFDGVYLRIYRNGYFDGSATNPLLVPSGLTENALRSNSDFYIGYMPGYGDSCPEMYMDYIGVFNCALTYEEVLYVHEYWR